MAKQIPHEISDSEFENELNENYETVTVVGMEFGQGTILRECDPTAFRMAKSEEEDYRDSERPIWACDSCGDCHDTEEEADECCAEEEEE